MTPVCGIVVTVTLFAVTVTTVFGANNICFLKCRTKRGSGKGRELRYENSNRAEREVETGKQETKREARIKSERRRSGRVRNQHHVNIVTVAIKSLNWMLHMACNEIQH